jgi:hypothetical protein
VAYKGKTPILSFSITSNSHSESGAQRHRNHTVCVVLKIFVVHTNVSRIPLASFNARAALVKPPAKMLPQNMWERPSIPTPILLEPARDLVEEGKNAHQ